MNPCAYYDARLLDVVCETEFDPRITLEPNAMMTLKYMEREIALPCLAPPDLLSSMRDQVGMIGIVEPIGTGGFHYRFTPYLDQSLRRRYELDNNDWIGWVNDSKPKGWTAPRVITPGIKGQFVEDNTSPMSLPLPPEFLRLCDFYDLGAWDVLTGFMADLCGLESPQANPRADGFSCAGSDEHMLARDYFERSQHVDLDDYDRSEE